MQPTTERLCLDSEYSNYKTSLYTCEDKKKNKIIFYPTTQNSSILRNFRNTNYTPHNTSNVKLHLKTSNVPFLKRLTRNPQSLEVFRPKQIKTQETWSWVQSWPYFEETGLEVSWDNIQPEFQPTISHMVCMLIVMNPVFSACDNN